MRDYRKFCRPKTIKNPLSGDYEVTLNCGSTVYVSKDEFEKKTNKYFRNYKEYEKPIPNNMIKYTASEKLLEIAEATYGSSGLAYKYIDANIVRHTFKNGIGIIEFDKDVTEFTSGSYLGWGSPAAFINCAITSITLPNSITSIGQDTFSDCSDLTSVTIPNGVTSISERAFKNCSSLSSVTIPNSVITIRQFAFTRCSSLSYVIIGSGTTSIEGWAFNGCSSLTSLTIPENVASVGGAMCGGCTSLEVVTILPTTPPSFITSYYGALFENTSKNLVIYVPAESVDAYKAASGWNAYASKIQAIPEE